MSSQLLTLLFWSAAAAVVVAQWQILRSTARAWQHGGARVPVSERLFAFGPALVILVVLYLSWRSATTPPAMQVELVPAPASQPR